jgi:hypothetical protein
MCIYSQYYISALEKPVDTEIRRPDSVETPEEDRSSPGIAVNRRSIEELDAAICRLARHLHAEKYRLLVLIRDFDDRFGWAKWSFKSCAEWLAWRCQLSLSAAREKVRTAHALRELPAISAAFAAGRLSYSKVRALTRVAQLADEKDLLAYALDATAAQVEERCRQLKNVAPESVETARRAWEQRSLTVARNPARGTLLISVEVPAEDGELVLRALDSAVAAGEVALGVEYVEAYGADRSEAVDGWRAQQADALVALAKAYLAERAEPSALQREESSPESATPPEHEARGAADAPSAADAPRAANAPSQEQRRPRAASLPDHYQVIVHVDERALRGGPGRADLPVETVKRLVCDGNLIGLVEDATAAPLALGRKRRVVSPALKRLLWARDRGCTFPGCHRKHYAEAHHIRHWIDGGKTDAGNTTLLCSFHHRLLHEGGFTIRRRGARLDFLRADGRTIPRSGYRPEDIVDEPAVRGSEEEFASIERQASAEGRFDPSRRAPPSSTAHGHRESC